MTESAKQRLFFAIWPGGQECRQLDAYRSMLRGCGGRKVPSERLHLTLAFLGGVDSDTRDCLIAAADTIDLPPFTLQLDKFGFWRRPQVVWLGSEEVPEGLSSLLSALNGAIRQCGLEPESRPFRTHLTLLRKAHRPPRQREVEPMAWTVERFVLVASETRPEGAVYEILKCWELKPQNTPRAGD